MRKTITVKDDHRTLSFDISTSLELHSLLSDYPEEGILEEIEHGVKVALTRALTLEPREVFGWRK